MSATLVLATCGLLHAGAADSRPSPPVWLASTIYDDYGKVDRVPLPWTPISTGPRQVRVWGRTARWAGSLLPASVESQGEELLARPMVVRVRLGRRSHDVPLGSFRFTRRQKSRVGMVATGAVDGLSLTADMWIEYDGFLWVSLSVEDTVRDRRVERLEVVVPLVARKATLYQTFSRPLTGWVGREPIRLAWLAKPGGQVVNFYHWFGNEDGGLGFTFTSLEHWRPTSSENFCTFHPGENVATYVMRLIEDPAVAGGRTFRFGIQATPIKPLPPDYHSMFATTLEASDWKAWRHMPENVDMTKIWPRGSGAMPGLNAPYRMDATCLARATAHAHDQGVAFLGCAACPQKISTQSREFERWKSEWQVKPDSVLDWHGVPQLQNCGKSYTLRKWLFYGWAVENVTKLALDGIYFDGWQAGQIACHNARHGCGWVDDQGRRRLTAPVLEGREFNQRMILYLEDHVAGRFVPPKAAPKREGFPRYQYWIHSWTFAPSVMGFATTWLTGEFAGYPLHGRSTLKPDGTIGKCVGTGLLRSRCLSTNWGVPNMFHVPIWEHTKDHATDRQTRMAFAWLLPHGIPVGEARYMNQKTVLEVYRVLLAFRTRQAHFTPCWRPNPHLRVRRPEGRSVVVATWDHAPQRRVLAVVSNLNVGEPRRVSLAWRGFPEPVVTNARTKLPIPLAGNTLDVDLKPESFALLLFTTGNPRRANGEDG